MRAVGGGAAGYRMTEVERLLRVPRATLRALIREGLLRPDRGPRREYRFGFGDLVLVKAATGLHAARLPRGRIRRALGALRARLPPTLPPQGLRIVAQGDRVAVREGGSHWDALSGQYLLAFEVSPAGATLRFEDSRELSARARRGEAPARPELLLEEALALEARDARAARAAYERCIERMPEDCAAYVNLGRLLHEAGELPAAERLYRKALECAGSDATLLFNLAVLLEDTGRIAEAMERYLQALAEDPRMADAHYNLARLYEARGQRQQALRHLIEYRRFERAR